MTKSCSALVAALVFSLPPVLATGGEEGAHRHSPCPRKAPRDFARGTVTKIEDEKPPCRLIFRETGVRLEAVTDGSRPDPGRNAVVDSDGRFYSTNAPGFRSVISVWDPGGEYVTSFGGVGEGPGEFSSNGALMLFTDGENNLHVRDGGPSWSVFSPDHEFIRRVPATVMGGYSPKKTIILDAGMALTSNDGRRSDTTAYFFLVDSAGALHRTLGPVKGAPARSRHAFERYLAYGGGDTFWASALDEDPDGYVLEEWGADGALRRALRRNVSWYAWRGERLSSTGVVLLHIGENGLLFVAAWRPSEEYIQAVKKDRPPTAREESTVEIVFEMIDTRSGELLASEAYRLKRARELLSAPLRGDRRAMRAYRYQEGEDGLPFVDILALELVAR